jgi:hypothetical protein
LDVGGNEAAQSDKRGSDDEEFFHAAGRLSNLDWGWQWIFPESKCFLISSNVVGDFSPSSIRDSTAA